MAFDARVRKILPISHLIDGFILGVAPAEGEFGTFFKIDNKGNGDPFIARPTDCRKLIPVAKKISHNFFLCVRQMVCPCSSGSG